jgi:hypothetical protein
MTGCANVTITGAAPSAVLRSSVLPSRSVAVNSGARLPFSSVCMTGILTGRSLRLSSRNTAPISSPELRAWFFSRRRSGPGFSSHLRTLSLTLRAILESMDEAQTRPDLVNRADFIVHQAV